MAQLIGALLMLIHIWKHLGGYSKEIIEGYETLVRIDPYRRHYYNGESLFLNLLSSDLP